MERPVSLKQLLVFAEVARDASLSEAAERLLMSKSSVSQSLTELEGRMGVSLFERQGGATSTERCGEKTSSLGGRPPLESQASAAGIWQDVIGTVALGRDGERGGALPHAVTRGIPTTLRTLSQSAHREH